jgi:chitin synthase
MSYVPSPKLGKQLIS